METNTEIQVKQKGKPTKNNEAFTVIEDLKKGEFTVIKKDDWKMETIPGQHLIRRRTNLECLVQTLADDSGWKITRL